MTLDAVSSAWKIIPGLKSKDIRVTAKFYTDGLRCQLGGMHQHVDSDNPEPFFLSIAAGAKSVANMYYSRWEANEHESSLPVGQVWVALGTDELDQYYDAIVKKGSVRVVEKVEDKPWGYRQFTILDPDGNRLTFFRFLEGGNPGTEE